jgi:hypothetical protein
MFSPATPRKRSTRCERSRRRHVVTALSLPLSLSTAGPPHRVRPSISPRCTVPSEHMRVCTPHEIPPNERRFLASRLPLLRLGALGRLCTTPNQSTAPRDSRLFIRADCAVQPTELPDLLCVPSGSETRVFSTITVALLHPFIAPFPSLVFLRSAAIKRSQPCNTPNCTVHGWRGTPLRVNIYACRSIDPVITH